MKIECPIVLKSLKELIKLTFKKRAPQLTAALMDSVAELLINRAADEKGVKISRRLLAVTTLKGKRALIRSNMRLIKSCLRSSLASLK